MGMDRKTCNGEKMIISRRGALYGYPQKIYDTKGYPQGDTPTETS